MDYCIPGMMLSGIKIVIYLCNLRSVIKQWEWKNCTSYSAFSNFSISTDLKLHKYMTILIPDNIMPGIQ